MLRRENALKALVLGFDGASPKLINKWVKDSRANHLANPHDACLAVINEKGEEHEVSDRPQEGRPHWGRIKTKRDKLSKHLPDISKLKFLGWKPKINSKQAIKKEASVFSALSLI